jgi:NAD dependent epimerase/dehydratase family enzyme
VSALRVTVTGATGLIGPQLIAALHGLGAEVTVLSRDPARAEKTLGAVDAVRWDLMEQAAPAEALSGRDAVVHLAGEPVAQRWSAGAKRAIRASRVVGTRNLIEGISQAEERPPVLVSSSAIGYYGAHGEEPLDEDAPPGSDFLAEVCVAWETERLSWAYVWFRCAQGSCWTAAVARSGRCCRRFASASVARSPVAGSTSPGSTPTTWSG